jgi:myo-inositol-1(or 4)-monophosphatase
MDYDRILETAIQAAREGGRIAVERLGRPGPIISKGARDVVTPAILEVQERILGVIRAEFPDHPILSEELDQTPEANAETRLTAASTT